MAPVGAARASILSDGFTPRSIEGLTRWYDATKLGHNDQDTVNTWEDLSDTGDDLDGSGTPIYVENGINGNPSIDFAMADYFAGSVPYSIPPETSAFFIFEGGSNVDSNHAVAFRSDDGTGSADNNYYIHRHNYGDDFLVQAGEDAGGDTRIEIPASMGTSPVMASSEAYDDGSNMVGEVWLGSTSQGTGTNAGSTFDDTYLGVGGDWDGGASAEGALGEIIVYNKSLTIDQRQAVWDYLSNKWGVSL